MEIFQVIALLCQVGSGANNVTYIAEQTLKCQKHYVQCLKKKADNKGNVYASGLNSQYDTNMNITACIEERKL